MIKNYNQYIKESLLDKMKGPSEQDVIKYFNVHSLNFDYFHHISDDSLKLIKHLLDEKLITVEDVYKKANMTTQERLIFSIDVGDYDGVVNAVKSGAEPNSMYSNPIARACFKGETKIFNYLINKATDFLGNRDWGTTESYLIDTAIERKHYDIFKILVKQDLITYSTKNLEDIEKDPKLREIYHKEYKKPINKFIRWFNGTNESLLNKLEGPSKEELIKHYKNSYLNNKMNLFDYYIKSLEYGFDGPTKKEVEDYLYGLYNNKKMRLEEYYTLSRDYNLEGPTKDYIWKQYGFDKHYEPEEYFVYLTEGMEQVSPNGLYYEWVKDGKRIFEQYLNPEKLIFMKYNNTFKIYEILFDMDFREFNKLFHVMMNKYFGDKINIYEYEIRIEYKY